MKKVVSIAILFCVLTANAQDKGKSEIRVGYSDATFLLMGEVFANALS
ncbi:hypothetical protein [Flavobacterium sp. CFS9]